MAYTGHQRPNNKIISKGKPLTQELKVENATNMYPGRLVKKGTNQDDMVVSTAADGDIIGWLGYEHTAPAYRPESPTTIYIVDDQAVVLSGGSFVILAECSGALATKGTAVKWATGGIVTAKAAADAAWTIGYTEDASANGKVLVRSVI